MEIQYLSHHEAAQFHDMIHEDGDLASMFGTLIVQMEVDTDYDTVLISFDDDTTLRIAIEDSRYVIVLDEEEQIAELYVRQDDDDELELELDGEYDLDEDGIMTIVDVMASRVFGEESDGI